jgi:tetratricopeptide (TPR) repeat protein
MMIRCPQVLIFYIALLHMHAQVPSSELQLGIEAYRRSDYPAAVNHLEKATSTDPQSADAHFYMGQAYELNCPFDNSCGAEWFARAMAEYTAAIKIDPSHKDALKVMAYLLYRAARFDEAEAAYRKAAKLDGHDPEPLYSISTLIFRRTYPMLMQEKRRLHLSPKESFIRSSECQDIRARQLADIEEGIGLLSRANALVNDTDVQTYLAVFYMARAQLQCGDRSAYDHDRTTEQQWWNRACVSWHERQRAGVALAPRWIAGQSPPPPRRGDTCRWW